MRVCDTKHRCERVEGRIGWTGRFVGHRLPDEHGQASGAMVSPQAKVRVQRPTLREIAGSSL